MFVCKVSRLTNLHWATNNGDNHVDKLILILPAVIICHIQYIFIKSYSSLSSPPTHSSPTLLQPTLS